MEFVRHGEPLIRLGSSQLPSFLVPSVPTTWQSVQALRQCQAPRKTSADYSRRHFSLALRRRSEAATAVPKEETEKKDDPLSGLFTGQRHVQRGKFETTSSRDSAATASNNRMNAKLSRLFPRQNSAGPLSQRGSLKPGQIAGSMIMPKTGTSTLPREAGKGLGMDKLQPLTRNKRTIRSHPTVGRTVEVEPQAGVDLGRALRKLGVLLAANKVRQEQMRQRFHERPGLRRKREKSERWRVYFKEGFQAAVARVKKMRNQGW